MALNARQNRPRHRTPIDQYLAIPEITADMRQRVGSSQIDEFVLGHSAADILRELVQNEFDACGSQIGIRFKDTMLEITGTGRDIVPKGWRRLSVLIGTGEVLGDSSGEIITPKESSIGSKNLGMRSLFRFGDQIHVRSAGRMATLDLRTFTAGRQTDSATKGRKGVLIQVPYRSIPLRKFVPFTAVREAGDLAEIERVLFPTLVKLALPGRTPGIRALSVNSERLGRQLEWRQEVKTERSRIPGIAMLRRTGRLATRGTDGMRRRQRHEELEFARSVKIPAKYAGVDFPAYYGSEPWVRIAVSISLKAGRPITDRSGFCYYPLQAGQARTGCAVSISAPFQLDAERTRLLADSDWNSWLSGQAADLVADLLGPDWFGRFGRAAYDLVLRQGQEDGTFADLVLAQLKERACWPNASAEWSVAKSLVVPADPALSGHLEGKHYLHPDLATDPRISELAVRCGAKWFTIDSLVRLRCAGEKLGGLETRVGSAADYHYTNYASHAPDPEVQHRSASALTVLAKKLSPENRRDLRQTPSTLTATGRLEAAEELVRVSPDMWEACPEPLESRLHPLLHDDLAIARQCRPFELARWIEEAAGRAADGAIAPSEHEALYRHLLMPETKLSSRLVGIVRRSPVLKDDQGNWARPDSLALIPGRDARLLGRVVRGPAAAVRQRPDLLDRLAIRRKVVGDDLVALAQAVEASPELAEPFEELLRRQAGLLVAKVVAGLSKIRFLRSRAGSLIAPSRARLPTSINLSCLSEEVLLADDRVLYRRLGCPARPGSQMLLEIIERARAAAVPAPVPHQLYPALVEALIAERHPTVDLADLPVLHVNGYFVTPNATLVALRPPRCLQEAIPVIRGGGGISMAYLALGASASPKAHHWLAFFNWIDRRAAAGQGRLSATDRALLREAYRYLAVIGLPSGLPTSTRCLLSSEGTVHSLDDLQAGRFLENDYPELAEALVAAKGGIAFADGDEMSRLVFRRVGILPLSERCGEGRIVIGAPAGAPNWFQAKTAAKALEQLHRPELAQGIAELAYAHQNHQKQSREFHPARTGAVRRRLLSIERIAFASDLQRSYQLGRRVSVPADSAIEDGSLYLRPPQYRSEYDHILALELARLAGATRLADVRVLASSLLPLLQVERPAEVFSYLRRLGIRPVAWDYVEEIDPEQLEAELTREQITQNLIASVRIAPPSATTPTPPNTQPVPVAPIPPTQPSPRPLPALDDVRLSVSPPTGSAPPASLGSGGGWRGSTIYTPRTPAEMERDRLLGLRGEALIHRQELERVRGLGCENPEEHVVWVSQGNPGADHDILSIGADGKPIWIEVKSTVGQDGRFDWSIAEFEKALREGPRYQLWRVYDVAGRTPIAKCFDNPAGLLLTPTIRLEISSLRAFVESR
jgi:hypothetical protein